MKKTPTYNLTTFKKLFPEHGLTTKAALRDALSLGLSSRDIDEVIQSLTPSDFYKSMPSDQNPGLWQDVYRPKHLGIVLYVKLQISETTQSPVLISFKEK